MVKNEWPWEYHVGTHIESTARESSSILRSCPARAATCSFFGSNRFSYLSVPLDPKGFRIFGSKQVSYLWIQNRFSYLLSFGFSSEKVSVSYFGSERFSYLADPKSSLRRRRHHTTHNKLDRPPSSLTLRSRGAIDTADFVQAPPPPSGASYRRLSAHIVVPSRV